ncbi:MAG: ABC transporter substrate-binding protein [Proteobacteria bacterium]|nr:ABC transporter substrate-binding protein [Pseudomonadota bacterium]
MEQLTQLVPLTHIWPGYAPIALVSALGYDRDEGIDVRNVSAGSPTEALAGVIGGKGDMTFVNTAFGFVARDRDEPFRMFYAFARRMNRSFAVLADSPIRTIAGLKGARIALHFGDLLYFARAPLIDEGLDPERDVKFVDWRGPLDEADQMLKAVRAGEVQAIWQLDMVYGLFAAAGSPLRRLPARNLDRLTPSASVYVHDRTVAKRGAALGAYGCALAKATLFAMTNPEAAIRLVWEHVPATRPPPGAERRVLRRDLAVLQSRLENSRPNDAPDKRWGAITEAEMVAWQDFMLATGAIRNRRPPSDYFSGAFVDRFNAFDPASVISRATAKRPS